MCNECSDLCPNCYSDFKSRCTKCTLRAERKELIDYILNISVYGMDSDDDGKYIGFEDAKKRIIDLIKARDLGINDTANIPKKP